MDGPLSYHMPDPKIWKVVISKINVLYSLYSMLISLFYGNIKCKHVNLNILALIWIYARLSCIPNAFYACLTSKK